MLGNVTTQITMDVPSLGLLGKLPRELRDEIYNLVIGGDPGTSIIATRHEIHIEANTTVETGVQTINQPALSFASKQLREEVLQTTTSPELHHVVLYAPTIHAGEHVAQVRAIKALKSSSSWFCFGCPFRFPYIQVTRSGVTG